MTSLIDCGLESKFNLFNIALMLKGSLILTIQEEDDNEIISIHKRRRFPFSFSARLMLSSDLIVKLMKHAKRRRKSSTLNRIMISLDDDLGYWQQRSYVD